MTDNTAMIGFPIQAMVRAVTIGSNMPGVSTISRLAGGAITAGAGAVAAMSVATAVLPSLGTMLGKDANQTAAEIGSTSINPIEALLTFMDLQANILRISERARIARIDVPGREGDFIQNLGGKSVDYRVEGKFFAIDIAGRSQSPFSEIFRASLGNTAVGNTQLLRLLERSRIPVPFMTEYDIAEVIIEKIELESVWGRPTWVNYKIDLIEYRRLPTLIKVLGLAALGAIR